MAVYHCSLSNLMEHERCWKKEWAKQLKHRCAELVVSYSKRLKAVNTAKGPTTTSWSNAVKTDLHFGFFNYQKNSTFFFHIDIMVWGGKNEFIPFRYDGVKKNPNKPNMHIVKRCEYFHDALYLCYCVMPNWDWTCPRRRCVHIAGKNFKKCSRDEQ